MAKSKKLINKTRASRDGHEFHEAWAARKALQLLLPQDKFIGVAIEGLHPVDQAKATAETVEIADLVLYYGKCPTFSESERINIIQLKYSISSELKMFRMADAKKTIKKFAITYINHKENYPTENVQSKLDFELVTNRPIDDSFIKAIESIKNGILCEEKQVKKQVSQLKQACSFQGEKLVEFIKKFTITGSAGSLNDNKEKLARTLVDWSPANDATARAQLGSIKQLIRDKAGSIGEGRNVITRMDIIDILGLQDESDLFPCPESFPEVGGNILDREQLPEVIKILLMLEKPLLIHAAGGIGKTVFLQTMAKSLSNNHQVILFDCFGGGAYRAPEDSRHLPKRGFVHIVNELACRGLCDLLLPTNDDIELLKGFRRRLSQAVETLKRTSPESVLILFIDAIDNAAEVAKDNNQACFPKLLLESLSHNAITGLKLTISSRTHRREITSDMDCNEYELRPFSQKETERYLRDRIEKIAQQEIQVAHARSEGNPRVLEHLVSSARRLLNVSEVENIIKLNDLLENRIQKAFEVALKRGYKKKELDTFLAGLSVLPPPVPLKDYADAHGIEISAIESFAADMVPLLERTKHGLIFRDEPTETLIRDKYASDLQILKDISKKLFKQQGSSIYAARALPGLLMKLDEGDQLFKLAFEDRFPASVTSIVGKQVIRCARLKAAIVYAIYKNNYNHITHLLIELSTIESFNRRGAKFILDNPDLVIASKDLDATRRLFEIRGWRGINARFTIANILSGEFNEACRYSIKAEEWIEYYFQKDNEYKRENTGPNIIDIAAIPLSFIAQNRIKDAICYLRKWKDSHVYEIAESLFIFLNQTSFLLPEPALDTQGFLMELQDDIGILTAALLHLELKDDKRKFLIKKLSKACQNKKSLDTNDILNQEQVNSIRGGLLKVVAMSLSINLKAEALKIFSILSFKRPDLWSFTSPSASKYIAPFVMQIGLGFATKGKKLSQQDVLPRELQEISISINENLSLSEFKKALKEAVIAHYDSQRKKDPGTQKISHYDAEQFIDKMIEPLLEINIAFSNLISTSFKKGDEAFINLLNIWVELKKNETAYAYRFGHNHFFKLFGLELIMFVLWSRIDLEKTSIENFLGRLNDEDTIYPSTLIELVSILSKRNDLHNFAGELAVKASSFIQQEDDVENKARFFAQLARAIFLASSKEASTYFRIALEHLDAIGSGDYTFINELLLFASSLKGKELEEKDFHTLTNICELNMPYEEEKFHWLMFAKGLSKVAGCKVLAKLGRWDDRLKISLNYTLLPYLTALIENDKIDPENALSLLKLCNSAELWVCNTANFAESIAKKNYLNKNELAHEIFLQFNTNNPGISYGFKGLYLVAKEIFGDISYEASHLNLLQEISSRLIEEQNNHRNYRNEIFVKEQYIVSDIEIKNIVSSTNPMDETSLFNAIESLKKIKELQYSEKYFELFFNHIRDKVNFCDQYVYIKNIVNLNNLSIYSKINELEVCKSIWEKSSISLNEFYVKLGLSLVKIHSNDLFDKDRISISIIGDIEKIFDVPRADIALELLNVFLSESRFISASIYMTLAAFVCEKSNNNEGEAALIRFLRSDVARFARSVLDGPWKDGCYPSADQAEVTAGLIWLKLGSPAATDRWRAAHSVRCLAKFNKWDVVDILVSKINSKDAGAFQASELPFYFLHAELWLLIALARIAKDNPQNIARYTDKIVHIALRKDFPHVLIRHFASQAIIQCMDKISIKLSPKDIEDLRKINFSPFPSVKININMSRRVSYYNSPPESLPKPKPEHEFYLEYDFEKYDVENLSTVFAKSGWEIKNAIRKWVRLYDKNIKNMYENRGREKPNRNSYGGMNAAYHSYGQYLGWHALFLTAGEFLSKYPALEEDYGNLWVEWMNQRILTRSDGLWLSDGVDEPPLDTKINLLEMAENELVITSNREKLLGLVGISSSLGEKIIVDGSWLSCDDVNVGVYSELVSPKKAEGLVQELLKKQPFDVYFPRYENQDFEEGITTKNDYGAWITRNDVEAKLDREDPLGTRCVGERPYFCKEINEIFSLETKDPFNRYWYNTEGELLAQSEAWMHEVCREEAIVDGGVCLSCSSNFLNDVLAKKDAELLLFLRLKRYEKESYNRNSRFSYTTAIVRIKQDLNFEFYEGYANYFYNL